jgi:hypothetical protein
VKVTRHAVRRIKQRLGVRTKDRAKKIANKAFSAGVPLKELPEEVKEFVDKNCYNARVLVYKNFIYIFRGKSLVTLFSLPHELIIEIKRKEEAKKEEEKRKTKLKLEQLITEKNDIYERFNGLKCNECDKKLDHIIHEENMFQLRCGECGLESKKKKSIKKCRENLKKSITRKLKNKIKETEGYLESIT